jgi:signal transduction histidine kinase
MVSEMDNHEGEEMDVEVLTSMWPEDINEAGKQFNVERPGVNQDMLEEVTINEEPKIVDFQRLYELSNYSEKGSSQLAYLVKNWEHKQANAVRLLREELDSLSKQQQAVELKKLEILEEHRFEEQFIGDKRPISILDEVVYNIWGDAPRRKNDVVVQDKQVEIDAEYDTAVYWKQRAMHLERLLEASVQREQILLDKLQESIENLERQSSPVEELSQILKRADNFLHFVLQNAPVVIGHQDNELRYRFIYNHFPSLGEEEIIGKTDVEIFKGGGVRESQDFKKEVLERGIPAKREITFETELFGSKTFLIYVEPVFSKAGDTIGVNYMGMDVTDQVRKREKMAKLREEIAVQKAKETELNKTIHITEETMRAKQMLATMSHEIRSPLSGVVSMAEILSTTKLDKEQRQLLKVMISSGDLVLQLINDILDLSKVESGVMRLEATKFRPREVVRHVLQTAAASLQKVLTLEGHVADDVPIEVIGDVLRIRQILTNLISNAIKFTHEGKVGIKLYVIQEDKCGGKKSLNGLENGDLPNLNHSLNDEPKTCDVGNRDTLQEDEEQDPQTHEPRVWIRCDVHDTGIGIPEHALPTLFKKYMQVSADTARKYGGTGLGLAICKQLVELMGGKLTVSSQEHEGSIFTFILPYRVSPICDTSDDPDELSDMVDHDPMADINDEDSTTGFFQFQPRTLGSLFSSNGSTRTQILAPNNLGLNPNHRHNGFLEDYFIEDACSVSDYVETPQQGSESCCLDNQNIENTKNAIVEESKKASETKEIPHPNPPDCSLRNNEEMYKEKVKSKILLVDDNKINVMVARSMMKQLGHEIDVVNNGAEAVRAVQRANYSLVLMDVCMPVMNGLEATRVIRSFEETGNWDAAAEAGVEYDGPTLKHTKNRLPIVAMTANAISESAEECYANGMDSFVSKPVTFQNLKQCLQQYL